MKIVILPADLRARLGGVEGYVHPSPAPPPPSVTTSSSWPATHPKGAAGENRDGIGSSTSAALAGVYPTLLARERGGGGAARPYDCSTAPISRLRRGHGRAAGAAPRVVDRPHAHAPDERVARSRRRPRRRGVSEGALALFYYRVARAGPVPSPRRDHRRGRPDLRALRRRLAGASGPHRCWTRHASGPIPRCVARAARRLAFRRRGRLLHGRRSDTSEGDRARRRSVPSAGRRPSPAGPHRGRRWTRAPPEEAMAPPATSACACASGVVARCGHGALSRGRRRAPHTTFRAEACRARILEAMAAVWWWSPPIAAACRTAGGRRYGVCCRAPSIDLLEPPSGLLDHPSRRRAWARAPPPSRASSSIS